MRALLLLLLVRAALAVQNEPLQAGRRINAVQLLIGKATATEETQRSVSCRISVLSPLRKAPESLLPHRRQPEGLDQLPANSPCAAALHGATSSSTQTSHRSLP